MHSAPSPASAAPVLRGLVVEFDSPGALVTAAEKVRDAGYKHWDTHTPFPVHGIDAAMGIRPTRLPLLVFVLGVVGCLSGLALQWWTNSTRPDTFDRLVPVNLQGYPFLISDKPLFSLPANIPVIFELTVLFAALTAGVGMLAFNNLPLWHKPIFALPRFKRVTSDRFFLAIDAHDPQFDARRTADLLAGLGGTAVEQILADPRPSKLPRPLTIAGMVLICLALLPPLVAAKARYTKSNAPRIQPVQDMGNQEKYIAQQANPAFADGRAMRPAVAGTIARGDVHDDAYFYQGQVATGGADPNGNPGGPWATGFPPQAKIDEALLRRGQQRFGVFCAPCHGLGGFGDGTVQRRAIALGTPNYVPPTSLHDPVVLSRPNGHLFNTITNGIRTMPSYGDQIPEADRWAIIAYVRALERSQHAKLEDVPADLRPELR